MIKQVRKIEYSEEFERLWVDIEKPHKSGRKEQGYRVFLKMKEENKKLHEFIDKSLSIIGKSLEFAKRYEINREKYVSKNRTEHENEWYCKFDEIVEYDSTMYEACQDFKPKDFPLPTFIKPDPHQ